MLASLKTDAHLAKQHLFDDAPRFSVTEADQIVMTIIPSIAGGLNELASGWKNGFGNLPKDWRITQNARVKFRDVTADARSSLLDAFPADD